MLTSHPEPGEPDGGPVLRPATPMTSIQQFESPDAAEAHSMADQRAHPPAAPDQGAEAPAQNPTRVRPAAPSGADAAGRAVTDIQTTSGVPKVVIPVAAPVAAAAGPEKPEPAGPDEPEPDVTEPAIAELAIAQPGTTAPDTAQPDTAEPDTTTPDTAQPDTTTPDTTEPDAAEPAIAEPAVAQLDTTAADTAQPDTTTPDTTEPDAAEPAIAEPDVAQPTVAEPDTTAPDTAKPNTTEPDTTAPDTAEPDAAKADAAKADAAKAGPAEADAAGAGPAEAGPAEAGPDLTDDLDTGEPNADTAIDADKADKTADTEEPAESDAPEPDAAEPVETAQDESEAPAGVAQPSTPAAGPDDATPTDKQDIEPVEGDKAPTNPQPEVEVETPAEREPQPEPEPEAAAPAPDQAPTDPEATTVLVLPPGPGIDDTVVLRLPTVEDTVVIQLPTADDTVVIPLRMHDDTMVIPAATVAPPTDVATAVIPVVPGRRDGQRTAVAPPPDPGRAPKPARARREPLDLGHAPAVLTISALGVLMVALAYAGGRVSTGNAPFAYWVGQVVVFTPVVVRLLSRRMAGVAESFLLVMGLALHQYLLKWMYSPDQFRFPDELQHWLATTIIVQSGELFRPNPALPPAEHFPGLAELGAAVAELTGLPVTAAGVVVAGIAHLVFVGVLFAVVLRASNSPAVAGVACAIYATALHYLFFNSMFLYQTAALPFFMLAIWAVRRWRAEGGRMFVALAVAAMALTTVSHHVTALALVATLLLLALAELALDRPRRWSALAMPGVAAVVVAGWILLVATDVLGYLEEPVDQVVRTVSQLFSGQSDPASTTAPVSIGQLAVQGAGLLGLLVLYLAVTRDMVQRRDRDWWRWAAVAGGLVFFAGNGVRFLGQNGPEIAGRLSTFTYIPISILAAIGLVRGVQLIPARDADGHRWRAAAPAIDVLMPGSWNLYSRVAAGAAMITLLMIGARAGGWPPIASILPGPYLAGGYERSVDAYGVASADWQRTTLGPGNRVGGDATSVSLASTYGRQDPVREVGSLYYADSWGLEQEDLVQRLHVQYLVVDRRLSTQLPESGAYFESDPRSGQITSPLTVGQLGKFDTLTDVDRLYDNGTVRIYRTGVQ